MRLPKPDGLSIASELQKRYYQHTAGRYDAAHLNSGEGHELASYLLRAVMEERKCRSLLDVGAGTGRTLRILQSLMPEIVMTGIEPIEEMREVGHKSGLGQDVLVEGDGTKIPFKDGSFDVVSSFGVLHHVSDPAVVVAEMLRVAKIGIFISDSNRFGQGGWFAKRMKRILHMLWLWPLVETLRTRGRGFHISEGDGIYYSYSLFDQFAQIRRQCDTIHVFTLEGNSANMVHGSGQIAIFAVKSVC